MHNLCHEEIPRESFQVLQVELVLARSRAGPNSPLRRVAKAARGLHCLRVGTTSPMIVTVLDASGLRGKQTLETDDLGLDEVWPPARIACIIE